MAAFTLDDIIAAAEVKYSNVDITLAEDEKPIVLLNPLRLSKEKRAELETTQSDVDESSEDTRDEDQFEALAKMIRIVAETEEQGNALLAAIGDDLATLVQVFDTYNKSVQAGEALPSQD